MKTKACRWPVFLLLIVLIGILLPSSVCAQSRRTEEIVVQFQIPRLLQQDIYVMYDGRDIYLPLVDIFRLLEFNVQVDARAGRFTGYTVSPDDKFEIDLTSREAVARGEKHTLLTTEFLSTVNELWLRVDQFLRLFNLDMKFNFSALQVRLPLNKDFPACKKLERHQVQKRLRDKKIALKDVRRLPRRMEYFGGGVADWAISSSPIGGGGQYYNLSLGGMLLGGDLNVLGGGSSYTGLDPDQLTYRWHYYFQDNPYMSQLDLGHLSTSGLLGRSLKGGSITNRPQIQRKIFQTIEVAGDPGEGWEVELYLNNQLVDFTYTDHTGRYSFMVDIEYGVSEVLLKMFGPSGEITTERRYLDVPHNLVPERVFEYHVAAGATNSHLEKSGTYAQIGGFYGITDQVTAGFSGDLPLSTQTDEKATIAGEVNGQITGNLTASASVAPGYAAGATATFSRPSTITADASYTRFFENRFRNKAGMLHELRFSVSSPLKIGRRYYSSRFSISWNKFPLTSSIFMNYGSNLNLNRIGISYIGHYQIKQLGGGATGRATSELLVSPRFFGRLVPRLKLAYDHQLNQVSRLGIQWNRRLFKRGQLSFSYERNQISRTNQVMINFRFLSGFADFTSRMIINDRQTALSQIQRGSIRYDQEGHRVRFDRRNGVGSGSAVVRPFLDDNYNGVWDSGEEYIPELRARIKGGRARLSGRHKQYYYDGLLPYDQYLVEIDKYSLDNPLMKPTHENFEVFCYPNIVTAINVPVVIGSEVTGRVSRQLKDMTAGVGGIRVMVLDLAKESVIEVTTFSDGEYFYLGLVPGSYRAYPDTRQLEQYGYTAQPDVIDFTVEPIEGGTTVDNIDFLLIPTQ